ncbi:MAG: tRNA (N(6)-L-threonylcarbamoyladenosine(37)-C(2))-methylthiotransferase MtaB [Armatimonadetes bacterium]|nr:tRNA (N(6)-L-threonylcarbamoyladenosine(37)-C(2))-methylthiotransferase MtaB [Armatimonadota bacterium]
MSTAPRVAIKTLGCKLNQYESEQIREDFEALGFETVDFGEPADVHIINSCTVTHRTDRDSRRLSRAVKRSQPDALVIVTGCYAEVTPEAVAALEAVDIVAGNADKPRLAAMAVEWLARERGLQLPPVACETSERLVRRFRGHTRAFLKVQTGCNAHCAYCIIPAARGPSRSTPPDDVLRQAEAFVAGGHPELVLVGIHLGQYGRDLPAPRPTLADLVERLCAVEALQRLRLSSIEPLEVSDDLLRYVFDGGRSLTGDDSLTGRGKVCRHLHIPLQSGCDATLARMRRPYRREQYGELVRRIAAADTGIAVGANVMTGFPGETDEEFEQTREFVDGLPLAYLHVFTYSERAGTAAAEMPDPVNPEVRKRRTHVLREISQRKRAQFAQAAVGETVEVVVEGRRDGLMTGISDNYLQVSFEGPDELRGHVARVRIGALEGDRLVGDLC